MFKGWLAGRQHPISSALMLSQEGDAEEDDGLLWFHGADLCAAGIPELSLCRDLVK